MTTSATKIIRADHHRAKPPTVIERLADIAEGEIWLAKQKSAHLPGVAARCAAFHDDTRHNNFG